VEKFGDGRWEPGAGIIGAENQAGGEGGLEMVANPKSSGTDCTLRIQPDESGSLNAQNPDAAPKSFQGDVALWFDDEGARCQIVHVALGAAVGQRPWRG